MKKLSQLVEKFLLLGGVEIAYLIKFLVQGLGEDLFWGVSTDEWS